MDRRWTCHEWLNDIRVFVLSNVDLQISGLSFGVWEPSFSVQYWLCLLQGMHVAIFGSEAFVNECNHEEIPDSEMPIKAIKICSPSSAINFLHTTVSVNSMSTKN